MKPNRKSKSLLSFVLTAAALLFFGCTEARAETPAAETPPPAQPAAPAPAAQTAPAPKARREDVEPKTLADAKSELKAVRDERDKAEADFAQATSDLAAARAENTRLAEQFKAATDAATAAQGERDKAISERDTAFKARDNAATELATEKANVSRLEQLCKVKGVSPSAAVPLVEVEEGSHVYEKWLKASGSEKTALYRKHGKEIREEAARRGAKV